MSVILVCLLGCSPTGLDAHIAGNKGQSGTTTREHSGLASPPWRPGYIRPMVIDIHAHLSASEDDLIARTLRVNGIERIVNLSGGSPGRGAEASVRLSANVQTVDHFFNIDWRRRHQAEFGEDMAMELKSSVERFGFKGLKVSKALGLYLRDKRGVRIPVDWPELNPLFKMAGTLGIPVAIHTGDPKAFWEPLDEHNERYEELKVHPNWSFASGDYPSREDLLKERDRLLERHRETTFICVHFGNNPEDLGYVDRLLARHPNVVLDTSARVPEFGRHPAAEVRALFIKYADRIMFGTDIGLGRHIMLGSTGNDEPTERDIKPFFDAHWRYFEGQEVDIAHPTPIQGRWTVDAINLPEDVLFKLYRGNAARVLRL